MILWARGHVKWHDKLKTKYLLFCKTYGHQTCQGDDLWWGKLIHNVRWPSAYVITWGHVTNWKLNIPSSARSMTSKHGRLVTYGERIPTVESNDRLTLGWCVVIWQIVSLTYLLWKSLWPWSLASWWLTESWTHPWGHMFLWPPGHLRSRDKVKIKYFFLQKTYGHQTLQGADIWWDKAHNEVARLWSRDHKRSWVKFKT